LSWPEARNGGAGSLGGIFYLGEPGLATKMKLVNNLLASTFKEMYGLTYARGEETLDFSALYMILKELLNFKSGSQIF
jgi:hypothetical protein